MPSYKLTSLAEADLISIWLYIAEDNPDAADHVLEYLYLQCGVVSKIPGLVNYAKTWQKMYLFTWQENQAGAASI